MLTPSRDNEEPRQVSFESSTTNYRMPSLFRQVQPGVNVHEVLAPPGQRTWEVPTHNANRDYDMRVTETARHLTFEAEIARVRTNAPRELYERILEINGASGPKVIYERQVEFQGQECDSIQMSHQIPKFGVPSNVILEEAAAFDNDVQEFTPIINQAISDAGARAVEFQNVQPQIAKDFLGLLRYGIQGPS